MDTAIIDRVFKDYDVRGIADTEITEEFAYAIGNAFSRHAKLTRCVVGRDGRATSEKLHEALIGGLLDAGCDVIDAGLVSTPQMKWVVAHHNHPAGVMVTASHNPKEYNGFKLIGKGGLAIGKEEGLFELKPLLAKPVKNERGERTAHDHAEEFARFISDFLPKTDREVFIDASGGPVGREAAALMEAGDYPFTLYYTQIDPEFKVHSPNPLDEGATDAAKDYAGMRHCIGLVFDADGDRSFFVDEQGKLVPPDYMGALLVELLFKKGDGGSATVSSSHAVRDAIERKDGRFVLTKVGHANVQKVMVEHDLLLGIEKSGHTFLKESYTAENGLLCLLLVLKHMKGTLADNIKEYRENYLTSVEHNYTVTDRDAVIAAAKKHYASRGTVNTMDGVLCDGTDWWVSIRGSNTQPLVRVCWEAKDKDTYDALEKEAEGLVEPFVQSGETR